MVCAMQAGTSLPTSAEEGAGLLESKRRRVGLSVLVIVQVFFGLFSVFAKLSTDPEGGFAPRAVAFWRIAAGALVLGGLAAIKYRGQLLPKRSELGRLFCMGLFGIVVNQILALEGVARTSVTLAGMLMTLIPVFTYALALFFRQELLRPQRVVGIALALLGALILVLLRSRGEPLVAGANPLLGSTLIILNCLSYAGFLILARGILGQRPALWVIAWTFFMALLALPFMSIDVELWPAQPSPSALNALILMIVLCTIVSYLMNTFALARVSASTAASFIYLQPLVAGVSAWTIMGERPSAAGLWPVLLLFGGLWLVIRAKPVRVPVLPEPLSAPGTPGD